MRVMYGFQDLLPCDGGNMVLPNIDLPEWPSGPMFGDIPDGWPLGRKWHAASMKGSDGCRIDPKSNLWELKDDVEFDSLTTAYEVDGVFWGYNDDEPLTLLPFDGLPTEGESDDEWG